MSNFQSFGLLPSLSATLTELGLSEPTEIQGRAIPALLSGHSVVGVAETGSGKTLAYALPALHHLKSLELGGDPVKEESQPRAVVMVPNRELGEQVCRVFKAYTHGTRLRVRMVLGGAKIETTRENVKGIFEIVVATPGRLLQLIERGQIKLGDVRFLVFDEVDQMIDPGFLPAAEKIVGRCPPTRQLALFSATVVPKVETLIAKLFKEPVVIQTEGRHRVVPTLKTTNRTVVRGDRMPVLVDELSRKVSGGTLLFVNTREQCDTVAAELVKLGRKVAIYRGEMDKNERRTNLKAFRDGQVELLIATDLGSRGLDIDHIARVINYHLPQQMENYLHRVGRTARAGRIGEVVNFVTERDQPLVQEMGTVRAK